MKTTDLRVGNWVNINDGENPVHTIQVQSVELDGINSTYDKLGWRSHFIPDEIEPVPLSVDTLKSYGFSEVKGQGVLYPKFSKTYKCVLINSVFEIEQLEENMFSWIQGNTIVHIYSVHHLQNLWVDITRSELD